LCTPKKLRTVSSCRTFGGYTRVTTKTAAIASAAPSGTLRKATATIVSAIAQAQIKAL